MYIDKQLTLFLKKNQKFISGANKKKKKKKKSNKKIRQAGKKF